MRSDGVGGKSMSRELTLEPRGWQSLVDPSELGLRLSFAGPQRQMVSCYWQVFVMEIMYVMGDPGFLCWRL